MYFLDGYFCDLIKIALIYCGMNYDYCYLSAMHERNKLIGTDTIITGSSHAMNGIVEDEFTSRPINFSISSQYIYYDFLHIKRAVTEGAIPIKTCIINLGYYMLYQDVSLSKNIGRYMIPAVYYPLFGDGHNYNGSVEYDAFAKVEYDKTLFSKELVRAFCTEWIQRCTVEEGTYYGIFKTREKNSQLSIQKNIWSQCNEGMKEQLAIIRTDDHNDIYRHKESRVENEKIIGEMVHFLAEYIIRTIFAVFPFTRWYNQYINPVYKEDIFNCLDALEIPVEFYDLNELDCFTDEDFIDTDHLNIQRAVKGSRILDCLIQDNAS